MNEKELERNREYQKKYYRENKQVFYEKNKRRATEFLEIVRKEKSKPCMDCKVQYPYYVMDFDHRDKKTKKFILAHVRKTSSRKGLLEEIAKCDVVCANCHRERTHGPKR